MIARVWLQAVSNARENRINYAVMLGNFGGYVTFWDPFVIIKMPHAKTLLPSEQIV